MIRQPCLLQRQRPDRGTEFRAIKAGLITLRVILVNRCMLRVNDHRQWLRLPLHDVAARYAHGDARWAEDMVEGKLNAAGAILAKLFMSRVDEVTSTVLLQRRIC